MYQQLKNMDTLIDWWFGVSGFAKEAKTKKSAAKKRGQL